MSTQSAKEGRELARGVIKGLLIAAGIAIACTSMHAQELPDAPLPAMKSAMRYTPAAPEHHPWASKQEYTTYAAVIASELGDAWSTEHCLHTNPHCHEDILPDAIVDHPAAMYAYSLTKAIGSIYLQRRLERTDYAKHHVWFRQAIGIAQASHIALMTRQDAINLMASSQHAAPVIASTPEEIKPFINNPIKVKGIR